MSVDAECRKPLLGVGCKHRCQVDCTRALCPVESPDGLDGLRIHVHCLGAVAPARGDRQSDGHSLLAEVVLTDGCLGHAADGRRRNDDLHRLSVRITEIVLKQFFGGPGHVHGLLLQRFPDLQVAAPPIDGGTDSNDRIGSDQSALSHIGGILLYDFGLYAIGRGISPPDV